MTYLLTFLEGIASFISPCILPLVPMYITYFSGTGNKSTKKALINSLFFVLGFTLVFIALAIITSYLGIYVSDKIKYIKYVLGALSIILGLAYMGILKLNFLNSALNVKLELNNLNIIRSLVFGMLFSFSHAPCVGYFLGSALMLIARKARSFSGHIINAFILNWSWNSFYHFCCFN